MKSHKNIKKASLTILLILILTASNGHAADKRFEKGMHLVLPGQSLLIFMPPFLLAVMPLTGTAVEISKSFHNNTTDHVKNATYSWVKFLDEYEAQQCLICM